MMRGIWSLLALAAILLVISGCGTILPPTINVTTGPTGEITVETEPSETTATETTKPAQGNENLPRKTVTEGELVSFPNLQATDPDGDPITYSFTPPLDAKGQWQTKVGDAGEYKVTVTASDGKNSINQEVIIVVNPKNRPPQIILPGKEISIKEGDTITLNAQASDPDGDKVTLAFGGWMTTQSRETGYDDAGLHEVELTASDGTTETRETVRIMVENVNRAPVLQPVSDIMIKEGDKITVNPSATDPDGDKVTFSYGAPISPDGTWQTGRMDVGKYRVNVTASDGSLEAQTSFLLVVESLNNPPVIQIPDLVTVDEMQTVALQPVITDNEGDELTISYAGWMNSNTRVTTYDDSGSHLVTITVSDGINTVKKDVTVMVNDVNRAPVFGSGAFA